MIKTMTRALGALILLAAFVLSPLRAAEQSSYVMPSAGPMSMSTFVSTYLNPGLRALAGCHNGASAPANGPSSTPLSYQCWIDTTSNPALYKIYDGASWITLGSINTSTHVWLPYLTGGTSGGVPYFSAAGIMGSSAALAANAPVIGGGAGTAPSSITAGTDDQVLFGRTSNSPLFRSVTGDVTFSAGVSAVGANKIANGMIRQSVALALIGRSANSTGNVADIACSAASGAIFRESGSTIGCGSIDLSAAGAVGSSILAGGNGGTGNGFFAVSGPASSLKTFTFPNASATVLTSNAAVTVAQGGTGLASGTSGGILCFTGSTTLASSAALSQYGVVIGGGAGACPTGVTAGTNGQLLLGVSSAAPAFATMSQDCTITNAGVVTCLKTNNVSFGTAAVQNTGTSGANLPFLNGNNTWSGSNAYTGLVDFQSYWKVSGVSSPSQITSNQDNYNPGSVVCSSVTVLRISTDASRNITGLAGGSAGCIVTIINIGTQNAVLKNETTSTAANQFKCGADVTLTPDQNAIVWYDTTSSRWRCWAVPGSGGGGAGTVTSVVCGTGLDGGTITSSGTCSLSSARRTLPTTQVFTSGSGTYTTPANVLWIEIEVVGPGGGGSGGGSGGSPGTNGSAGSAATTFGTSLLTANAGGGATVGGGAGSRGAGGSASGGYANWSGGDGEDSDSAARTFSLPGGAGGNSCKGGMGFSAVNGDGHAGKANTGSGGGGAGGNTVAVMGSGGGAGGCLKAIIGSPSATYSYVVGSGGAGGSAGTSGNAGGAGASGIIIVIEHYGT